MEKEIDDVVTYLKELLNDNTVPRNVKTKIESIVKSFQEKTDMSLKINKALSVLEEISDDNNIQPYTRAQVWNAVSMLEGLN
jgi:uncharacterized protein (UPF0147 family)